MNQLSYPYSKTPPYGGTIEITPGLKWLKMPLPGSLEYINLYLIEDNDGWFIVDTGLSTKDTESYWLNVFKSELDGKPIKAVIVTHMHPDHIGQAGWLVEHWNVPLYMSDGEYSGAQRAFQPSTNEMLNMTAAFYHQFGFDLDIASKKADLWLQAKWPISPIPEQFIRIQDKDEFTIGKYHWRIVVGSGHSPEHACLFCEELNILISGDQLLPEITSNVSVYPSRADDNPLQRWLTSLNNFYQLPEETLVLPAHNKPFYGLHARAKYIIEHHEESCVLIEHACQKTKTGKELIPVLFKRELNNIEWGLAIGECCAHLNYLIQEQRLRRHVSDEGFYRYETCR